MIFIMNLLARIYMWSSSWAVLTDFILTLICVGLIWFGVRTILSMFT